MENEPEVIRRQMDETRASLSEKLETLEQQVVGTVHDATTSVTDTVASVKEAVRDTVATVQGSVRDTIGSVRDTFDITQAVNRSPWIAVGCSAFAGFVVGSFLRRAVGAAPKPSRDDSRRPASMVNRFALSEQPRAVESGRNGKSASGWISELGETFSDETKRLRSLALATALGAARDFLVRQVPSNIGPELANIVDSATRKLGGDPIPGPIMPPVEAERSRF